MFSKEDLPTVLIDKITLETVYDNNKRVQPHIAEDTETLISPDRFGHRRFEQIREEFDADDEDTNLKVTLDLSISDVIQDDSVLMTLMDDEMIRKYLRINIIQILNKNVLKEFIDTFENIHQEDIDKLNAQGKLFSKHFPIQQNKNIENPQEKGSKPLKSLLLEGKTRNVTHNVSEVHHFNFRESFIISKTRPKELYYIVFSYLDMQAMSQDFEINFGDSFKNLSSKMVIESVIKDGETVNDGYLFISSDGTIWSGLVTTDGELFYKYNTSEQLDVRQVPHNVIQDFRVTDSIDRLNIDFDFLQDELVKTVFSSFKDTEIESKRKGNSFSELCLTVDEDGNTRGLFSFNVRQFLMNNSTYGSLLRGNNEERLAEIYFRTKIKEIKLERIRIRNDKDINHLGVLQFSTSPFMDNIENIEKVISSGETVPGNFIAQDSEYGYIRQIRAFNASPNRFSNIKTYTFLDKSFKDITYGLYKYKVSVRVEDGTLKFLEDLLKRLESSQVLLQRYYSAANLPVSYDISSDRFSDTFKRNQLERYRGNRSESPWIKTVLEFVSIISLLGEGIDDPKISIIYKMISPETGNLTGLEVFNNLYDRVISQLKILVGSSNSNRTGTFPAKIGNRRKSGYVNALEGERVFFEVVDSDITKNSGMDFLEFSEDNPIRNQNGLKTVSGLDYSKRVEEETNKFFFDVDGVFDFASAGKTYASDISLDDVKLSYLSPSKIYDKKNGDINFINKGTNSWDTSLYNQSMIKLNNVNVKLEEDNINNLYENQSIQNSIKIQKDKREELDEDNRYQKATSLFGQNFKTDDGDKNKRTSKKKLLNPQRNNQIAIPIIQDSTEKRLYAKKTDKKKQKIDFYDINNKNNILDTQSLTREDIKEMPNQVKSLFLATMGERRIRPNIFVDPENTEVKSITSENKSSFDFHYNLLKVVEVLVGYRTNTNHDLIVREPIWEKLSIDNFNNAIGFEMVCRLRNYNGKGVENNFLNEVTMKTYNDYFILSPSQRISSPSQEKETNTLEEITRKLTEDLKEAAGTSDLPESVFDPDFLITRENTEKNRKVMIERDEKVEGIPVKYVGTTIFHRRKL